VLRSSGRGRQGREGEGALAYLKIFFFGGNKNKTFKTGCQYSDTDWNLPFFFAKKKSERIASVNCLGCCGLFPRPLLPSPLSACFSARAGIRGTTWLKNIASLHF
jgi:hypothetical protein